MKAMEQGAAKHARETERLSALSYIFDFTRNGGGVQGVAWTGNPIWLLADCKQGSGSGSGLNGSKKETTISVTQRGGAGTRLIATVPPLHSPTRQRRRGKKGRAAPVGMTESEKATPRAQALRVHSGQAGMPVPQARSRDYLGLEAESRKAATLDLSLERSSSRRYIMWPAS